MNQNASNVQSGAAVACSAWLGIGRNRKDQMNIATIDGTKHAKCEMCGKEKELRPYGPSGESVCFDCAMKDEESAKRQFAKLIDGSDLVVIK